MRLFSIIAISLVGCAAHKPAPKAIEPQPDKVVQIQVVTRYVSIPKILTKPCPIQQQLGDSITEIQRIAIARADSILKCNADKVKIQSIQGTKVPRGTEQ